jgi:hypothetical protein
MLYFDTSFIVPYILPEATSSKIQQFFREHDDEELCISHLEQGGILFDVGT